MPRIAPSDNGGSATADRVLSLLTAFKFGDDELTLAQMAWRTGLYKSTALRLLACSMAHRHLSNCCLPRCFLAHVLARTGACRLSRLSLCKADH